MEVRNCKSCGRLFNYLEGRQICPACKDALEKKFVEVRAYIKENPNSSIAMVSEAMDISTTQIQRWVREERLEFAKGSGVTINCEICGKPITTGRYCNECKRDIAQGLSSGTYVEKTQKEEKKDSKAKMRFLDKQ